MADLNYVNPGSLDPGVGFKPDGFLGGMEWQKRNRMFEEAQSLQQLMSTVGAKRAIGEFGEWQNDAPIRAAKGLADLATHQTKAEFARPDAQANLESVQATGRNTRATADRTEIGTVDLRAEQPSRQAAKIAEHIASQGTQGLTALKNNIMGIQMAAVAIQQGGGGPQATAQAYQVLTRAGIPTEQVAQIIGDGRPETIMKNLQGTVKFLQEVDVQHKNLMAVHKADNDSKEKVAGIGASATRYAANQRSAAKNQSDRQTLLNTKLSPEQAQRAAEFIFNHPETTAENKALAEIVYKRASEQLRNAGEIKKGPQLGKDGIIPPATSQAPLGGAGPTPQGSGKVIDFGSLPK